MAKDETKRLTPAKMTKDTNAFSALEVITGYTPADTEYAITKGTVVLKEMIDTQKAEAQVVFALKAARDNSVAAEWNFHNYILGAKKQVTAQFGDSSNEIQGMGLKKKTEYKKRTAKKNIKA